jgi:molybdenum cofactor cytidylyltransferase
MRAAILLAAGASRRFGSRDKLKARIGGRTLLDHAIANVRASDVRRIILVTARPVQIRGVTNIRARKARDGLAVSLAAGLAALRPIEREVLIFLADMPFARAPRMRLGAGVDAVRPHFAGCPGHPLLVRTAVARAHLGRGDVGLAAALDPQPVRGGPAHLLDIDTRDALRRARRGGSARVHLRS